MNNLSKFSKAALFLSVLSGALWMGSYLSRLFITYKMFEEQGTDFRSYINENNISAIFLTINAAVTTTFILYLIFILCFILFVVTSKLNLKNNGWLFIITAIIFLTLPFEIYLMTYDYKFISLISGGNFSQSEASIIFKKRYEILGSFPLVEIFSYFSIIYFMIFQPLSKKTKENEN